MLVSDGRCSCRRIVTCYGVTRMLPNTSQSIYTLVRMVFAHWSEGKQAQGSACRGLY